MGKLYYFLGENNYSQAYQYLERALNFIKTFNKRGELTNIVKAQLEWEVLYFLGKLEMLYHNDKKAEDLFLLSLEAVRTFEVGEGIKEGTILESIAELYELKGELNKAIEYYELSNEIYFKFGDDNKTAEIKSKIGQIYLNNIEDKSKAITYFEEALGLYQELNYNKESADILHKLGDIYIQEGMVELAMSNFESAKNYYAKINDDYNLTLVKEKLNSLTNAGMDYY